MPLTPEQQSEHERMCRDLHRDPNATIDAIIRGEYNVPERLWPWLAVMKALEKRTTETEAAS